MSFGKKIRKAFARSKAAALGGAQVSKVDQVRLIMGAGWNKLVISRPMLLIPLETKYWFRMAAGASQPSRTDESIETRPGTTGYLSTPGTWWVQVPGVEGRFATFKLVPLNPFPNLSAIVGPVLATAGALFGGPIGAAAGAALGAAFSGGGQLIPMTLIPDQVPVAACRCEKSKLLLWGCMCKEASR